MYLLEITTNIATYLVASLNSACAVARRSIPQSVMDAALAGAEVRWSGIKLRRVLATADNMPTTVDDRCLRSLQHESTQEESPTND